jgi:hypothetical protein
LAAERDEVLLGLLELRSQTVNAGMPRKHAGSVG